MGVGVSFQLHTLQQRCRDATHTHRYQHDHILQAMDTAESRGACPHFAHVVLPSVVTSVHRYARVSGSCVDDPFLYFEDTHDGRGKRKVKHGASLTSW